MRSGFSVWVRGSKGGSQLPLARFQGSGFARSRVGKDYSAVESFREWKAGCGVLASQGLDSFWARLNEEGRAEVAWRRM